MGTATWPGTSLRQTLQLCNGLLQYQNVLLSSIKYICKGEQLPTCMHKMKHQCLFVVQHGDRACLDHLVREIEQG